MTATTFDPTALRGAGDRTALLGIGNLVRKDAAEWLQGRRPWVVALVSTLVLVLAAANSRISAWAAASFPAGPGDTPPKVLSLLPMDNLLFAIGTQFLVLAVVFSTMGLLIAERDSGTLAWTISKPVSRTSVLLSKWLTATIALWVTAVVVPLAATTAVVALLYGTPDLAGVVVLGVFLVTVPALFVAVALAAAVFVPSQAAVGAVGAAVFIVPQILTGIVPALAPFLPTNILTWSVAAAINGDVILATPVALLVTLAILFAIARRRMAAVEL